MTERNPNSQNGALIASHLRDFAEFLPPEKREDFNATIDDLQAQCGPAERPYPFKAVGYIGYNGKPFWKSGYPDAIKPDALLYITNTSDATDSRAR